MHNPVVLGTAIDFTGELMGKSFKGRIIFDLTVGVMGLVAGAITVWQVIVPAERERAYIAGKQEIAAEVVAQLRNAGYDTSAAETALEAGDAPRAAVLATKAALAPPVAVVPDQPFELKEREVIDLREGGMLSFRSISNFGSYATIQFQIDGSKSPEMRPGDSFILSENSDCRLDFIDIRKSEDRRWTSTFRHRC